MKPEVKEKWLTALRSGEYEKAVGYMRREYSLSMTDEAVAHSYCCLGVLCDLYAKEHDITFRELFGPKSLDTHLLPVQVAEWSGIFGDSMTQNLARTNDTTPTFGYVIAIIEESL